MVFRSIRGCWYLAVLALTLSLAAGPSALQAQQAQAPEQVYLQLESHPDLATAESRVRAYANLLENVVGFRLISGWYAVALGPYDPIFATNLLGDLSAQGLVPRDAYLEVRPIYQQQFWPVGAPAEPQPAPELQAQATPAPDPQPIAPAAEVAEPAPEPQPAPQPVVIQEETVAEARQSEFQLDLVQRETLQVALEWFGFYNLGIDGDFGPGTRSAMANWQGFKGYEATGVLTTRQREELLGEYAGELNALGMQLVRDGRAGIEMNMPMAMVEFARYEFPFAQYEERDGSGVRIFLISQEGGASTLAGLYEIMQTLEIVPLDGERSRSADSFLLTGQSPTLRSHTEARLQDGQIKGFTLLWPPERDAQIERVLPLMQESFTPISGVLDPGAVSEETLQGVDLIAGLEVRRPDLVRSGFYATSDGTVLTTAELAANQCARYLIDELYEAELALSDPASGLAVLRPVDRLAPGRFAQFADGPLRLRSDIAVAGFPFEGALGAASLNFGELADLSGINGEDNLRRLDVAVEESEAGAPVLSTSGQVIGMVLSEPDTGRALPPGVSFALAAESLRGALVEQGLLQPIGVAADAAVPPLGRQALARLGADLAVTVSCWN